MKRRYRKSKRAESEAGTRLRIVEALVSLHGELGPARTTISDVARRAGVQRLTVYRHFPDERSMFEACTSHWSASHPAPDPAQWESIDDPELRLRTALAALYAYYRSGDAMFELVFRQLPEAPGRSDRHLPLLPGRRTDAAKHLPRPGRPARLTAGGAVRARDRVP